MNHCGLYSSVLHRFFWRPNLSAREISSRIFASPSPSIVDNVFHKPQGLGMIYFIWSLSLRECFMIVCLVWFPWMTREYEIGMKSSAPGDSRGPGTFFNPCNSIWRHPYISVRGGSFSQVLPIQDANAASQLCSLSVWEQGLNCLPFWSLADV
jgi:hypothetical protein